MIDKGLDEVRPTVLVIEIVGVFPNIAGQQSRLAFSQRVDRIWGRADLELTALSDEPAPAAAELADRSRLELLLELIETAAIAVDRSRDLAGRRTAAVRLHAIPE